jgi:hypothetical protein
MSTLSCKTLSTSSHAICARQGLPGALGYISVPKRDGPSKLDAGEVNRRLAQQSTSIPMPTHRQSPNNGIG